MAPTVVPIDEARKALIDRYGELDRQKKLFDSVEKQHKSLREQITGWLAGAPANQPVTLSGNLYELTVSAKRAESRWKSKAVLWKRLGGLKSLHLWEVTSKAVKEALRLTDTEVEALQIKEQTGYRTFTPVLKAPAEQAKAA